VSDQEYLLHGSKIVSRHPPCGAEAYKWPLAYLPKPLQALMIRWRSLRFCRSSGSRPDICVGLGDNFKDDHHFVEGILTTGKAVFGVYFDDMMLCQQEPYPQLPIPNMLCTLRS
jgi:hypothetical protein